MPVTPQPGGQPFTDPGKRSGIRLPGSHSETYLEQNELGDDLPDSDLFGAGAFDGVHLGPQPAPRHGPATR